MTTVCNSMINLLLKLKLWSYLGETLRSRVGIIFPYAPVGITIRRKGTAGGFVLVISFNASCLVSSSGIARAQYYRFLQLTYTVSSFSLTTDSEPTDLFPLFFSNSLFVFRWVWVSFTTKEDAGFPGTTFRPGLLLGAKKNVKTVKNYLQKKGANQSTNARFKKKHPTCWFLHRKKCAILLGSKNCENCEKLSTKGINESTNAHFKNLQNIPLADFFMDINAPYSLVKNFKNCEIIYKRDQSINQRAI